MPTAIHCGTLIDGNGGDPLRNAVVVIEDGAITAVNADGSIPVGADVIDATGSTVMPGMIDCHVHLMSSPPRGMEQRLATPFSLSVAEALKNAQTSLDHGFTTLRDAGGTPRGVRLAIERGIFPGPRLRIAVSAISQTGGHGDATMVNGIRLRVPNAELPENLVDGPEGARKTTREILRAGADQIKIMTSGGVLSPKAEAGRWERTGAGTRDSGPRAVDCGLWKPYSPPSSRTTSTAPATCASPMHRRTTLTA